MRVRLEGKSKVLSLAEVQVHQTGDGAKLHRKCDVSQSSTLGAYGPHHAIDGNLNQSIHSRSLTHTSSEPNPYWLLDLGGVKEIGRIKIFNRSDAAGDRLAGAVVEILDPDNKVVWAAKIIGVKNGSVHKFVVK